MLRIALKRCRLSARNGWLLGAWAVGAALAAATVWVGWIGYGERVDLFEGNRIAQRVKAEDATVYVGVEIGFERPPTPLSLISRGVGEDLGVSARIRGRYREPELARRDRPRTGAARRLNADLAWTFALVLGFTGVFAGHGVINGERRAGTLKLQLRSGLPRPHLLLGEFLGGLIVVAIPLLLFCLGFLAWAATAGPSLDGREWLRVLLFFGLATLYGAFWVALSLCLSVFLRQRETSLLVGILIWVSSAALYQPLAGWAATRAAPPALEAAAASADRDVAARRAAIRTRRNVRAEQYMRYRTLASLGPVTAFQEAARLVATTSVDDHIAFLADVDDVERRFIAWQAEKLERYPERENTMHSGQEALDIGGLPAPEYRPLPVEASLRGAALPVGALSLFTTLLLVGGVIGFEKLDLTEAGV